MSGPAGPPLRFVAHLRVEVGPPVELGDTGAGRRRVVPILGGEVDGELLAGRVLPGGTDHQVVHADLTTRLTARYVIETAQGELVHVTNHAVRSGTPAHMAALLRGEQVDPDRIYFRGAPTFETAAPRLASLTRRLHVATGRRDPDVVVLDVFEVG